MAAWGLLALLLALDLALVVCHIRLSPRQGSWNLEADNGYPEKLQYVKWLGGCLLLTLALRRHAAIYFGWAAICLYFLLDDAALLHEWIGERLAIGLGLGRIHRIYLAWFPGSYLRPQDFGELIVALIVAAAIAALLVLSWPARDAARERVVARRLLMWLGVFALFAVGVDMVHVMVSRASAPAAYVLGVIEDAGEMICASLLVGGLALELARDSARAGPGLQCGRGTAGRPIPLDPGRTPSLARWPHPSESRQLARNTPGGNGRAPASASLTRRPRDPGLL
jgi:hypothetical protein